MFGGGCGDVFRSGAVSEDDNSGGGNICGAGGHNCFKAFFLLQTLRLID